MGVEFIRNKRQRHLKAWNHQLLLRVEDMFASSSEVYRQVIRSKVVPNARVELGDQLFVRKLTDGQIVLSKDIYTVGCVEKASDELKQALDAHDGLIVGKVYECFSDLGLVDIELEI